MEDSRAGRGRGADTRSQMVPPRRLSLEERDAFPVEAPETLQAPPLPSRDLRSATESDAPTRPIYRLAAIVFVVVAALGAIAAARFFMAAAHRPAATQE